MGAMALAKLTILVETRPQTFNTEIVTLFNPNQVTIQKTTNWRQAPAAERDVPAAQFTHGDPATLTVELFFDTYEARRDVRSHTRAIAQLTTVEQHGSLHRPPICQLAWGQFGVFFQGVLEGLTERYTLFLEDGTPVRATLNVNFKEYIEVNVLVRENPTRSADHTKTYTVKLGDTLSYLAANRQYQGHSERSHTAAESEIETCSSTRCSFTMDLQIPRTLDSIKRWVLLHWRHCMLCRG